MQHYTYAHIRNDTGQVFYIGLGSVPHRYKTTSRRNTHWNNIVAKAGGFTAEKLAFWKTRQEAADHEMLLIASFKDMGYKLANISLGGESGAFGSIRSDETKKKMSDSQKGKPRRSGWKHTEEVKKRMSEHSKGRPKSPDAVKKSADAQRGRKRDPLLVEKTAQSHRGRKRSQETKDKMKAAWAAKKLNKLKGN